MTPGLLSPIVMVKLEHDSEIGVPDHPQTMVAQKKGKNQLWLATLINVSSDESVTASNDGTPKANPKKILLWNISLAVSFAIIYCSLLIIYLLAGPQAHMILQLRLSRWRIKRLFWLTQSLRDIQHPIYQVSFISCLMFVHYLSYFIVILSVQSVLTTILGVLLMHLVIWAVLRPTIHLSSTPCVPVYVWRACSWVFLLLLIFCSVFDSCIRSLMASVQFIHYILSSTQLICLLMAWPSVITKMLCGLVPRRMLFGWCSVLCILVTSFIPWLQGLTGFVSLPSFLQHLLIMTFSTFCGRSIRHLYFTALLIMVAC